LKIETRAVGHEAANTNANANVNRMKTNYSFEVQYNADSASTQARRDEVMGSLGPLLQQRLAAEDRQARVLVSDSHKGADHKLVELVTTLQDAQIARILQAFTEQYGVNVNAFE
jgi:hypothetical protein